MVANRNLNKLSAAVVLVCRERVADPSQSLYAMVRHQSRLDAGPQLSRNHHRALPRPAVDNLRPLDSVSFVCVRGDVN